jgi:urease accessory protein
MKIPGRIVLALLLGVGWTTASAHTGHGTHDLLAGLAHPFLGFDHLLAMVAVGVWSAAALPAGRRVAGPAVFMLGMLAGGLMGAGTAAWPLLDLGIAASVVLLGAMLVAPRAWSVTVGLALVGAAALLHGLAHGAELPLDAAFAGYAAGFLAATALLHGLGLAAGRAMAQAQAWAWRAAGFALAAAGLSMAALA